jgi:hypothetical protein
MRARVIGGEEIPYSPRGSGFAGKFRPDGKASCSTSTTVEVKGLPGSVKLPTKKMPKLPQVTKIVQHGDRKAERTRVAELSKA